MYILNHLNCLKLRKWLTENFKKSGNDWMQIGCPSVSIKQTLLSFTAEEVDRLHSLKNWK